MKIEVTASQQLSAIRLDELIGRSGTIVIANEHNTGFFVKLDEPYDGFEEWFIPNESIKYVN